MQNQQNQYLNYLNFNKENIPIDKSVSTEYQKRENLTPTIYSLNLNKPDLNTRLAETFVFHESSKGVNKHHQLIKQNNLTTINLNINNSMSLNKSFNPKMRSHSLTTRNMFDYNFQSQQQLSQPQQHPNLIVVTNSKSQNSLIENNHHNINFNQNFQQSHSPKIINDPNKFLENILTHSKRNTKQSNNLKINNLNNNQILTLSSNISNFPSTVLTINRTNEERLLYPDKLILERRNLFACPIIEGDDQLKLINYQHNQIKSIQNLEKMKNLIFLDLYDNRIERINGLSNLINLRVLMLGKNRIEKIENLNNLIFLDVLDLHGNQITHIENLNNLQELRVLNIAANQIKIVNNLNGLQSLVELNLRRNQITEINDLEYCQKLQRLFLSFNEINSLDSIKNLSQISNLQELTLDNNPLSNEKNYKRNVLAQLSSIKKLDTKKVTEEEKRLAERMFLKSEFKKREMENYYFLEEKKKTIIKDAKIEWSMQYLNSKTSPESRESYENEDENVDDLPNATNKSVKSAFSSQLQNQIKQNNSMINYQNYLQQYQNQTNQNNSNKINAKLKIVQMRNLSHLTKQQNGSSYLVSSSTNSILSNDLGSNKEDDPKPYMAQTNAENGEKDTEKHSLNSRSNSASSSSRVNQVSRLANNNSHINQTGNQLISSSATNIKRPIPYNNGSNIHEENFMHFYGNKSLEILDIKLDNSLISQVTTISFHYIDFDDLFRSFARIRNKFLNVVNLIFNCCNIKNLNQIDSLIEWKKIESLTINREDNPIYCLSIWQMYAICRLQGLQLKKINEKVIKQEELDNANAFLSSYLNLALSLPDYKLIALIGQEKKNLIKIAKETLNNPSLALNPEQANARDTIIKAMLTYNYQAFKNPKPKAANLNQDSKFVNDVLSHMNYNDLKKQKLKLLQNQIWMKLFEKNLKQANRLDKHVNDLCKKNKIEL